MSTPLGSLSDWYEEERLAPYVRSRKAGGDALTMIEVGQPAGDMSDPPTTDLFLVQSATDGMRHKADFGAGPFEERSQLGSLFLVPPHVATRIEVYNDHVVRCFAFPAARYQAMLAEARGAMPFDFGPLHRGGFRSPLIGDLLDRLWSEADVNSGPSRLFAEGAALTIIGELARLAQRSLDPPPPIVCDWRVRRAIDYLEARLADEVGLAAVAAAVDLSPDHLRIVFRTATGESPHRWLMRRRLERACEMLADPCRTITEIAYACGFASSQHLATTFGKRLGITPSAYRQRQLT